MIRKAVTFIREVKAELSQVAWPTPRELWESTKVVLAATVLVSLVIWTFDLVCAELTSLLLR